MSNARNLADLLDSNGDVKSDSLDNVSGLPDAIDVNASAPADSLAIDSSGDVGIGTTTPSHPLEVTINASGSQDIAILSNDNVGVGNSAGLLFAPSNGVTGARIEAIAIEDFSTSADRTSDLAFYTRKDGTLAERMRITSDGRGLSQFSAKAWVMANATGTPSIYDSHNISSLTDYETGQLGCNFANNMSNTNYAVISAGWGGYTWTFGYFDRYAGVFRIVGSNGSAYADASEVSAVVFGD